MGRSAMGRLATGGRPSADRMIYDLVIAEYWRIAQSPVVDRRWAYR
jgi:hypothetical protein